MKFLQRMILIYLVGGIIPLAVVGIYMNMQTRKMMIGIAEETQTEETAVLGSSIQESMSVLDTVSRLLCLNDEIQKLGTKKYKNRTAFYKDYHDTSAIADYMTFYQQDISYINIYLNNPSLEPSDLQRVKYLSYLSDSVTDQSWYKKTIKMGEEGYWYLGRMDDAKNQTIQISRALRDEDENIIGVVTVMMQYKKTKDAVDSRETDTAIFYKDVYLVSGNFSVSEYPFLMESIQKMGDDSTTKKVVYGVEEYLLTYQRVQPEDSSDYYSLVSIQKYQDIMTQVNKITVKAFLPVVFGVLLSVALIMSFSVSHGRRMNLLRVQMHRVAQGEYDLVEPIEGNDEIGELYQELEGMMKDIQMLTDHMVDEQVQKEKLHTKQKEVEFKMLASQINPHFLYNTLETIRMKAMVNHQSEIVELVKMLAKTMRYNIQVTDRLVTLKEELQMVGYYLKIQEYRFGDRITSKLEIDPIVDAQAKILPLTIQPFVENAFVHGLEEKDSDGKLQIEVYMEEDDICISIRDNGKGMDYYELGALRKSLREEQSEQGHIGVRNVNQRIKILYGEEYGVWVESQKDIGTNVTIRIPYVISEEGNL
jgi:two-component system sensor histidine kinase YesM